MPDARKDKLVLFLVSDDPERVYPAFFLASAAVAMETEVVIYFCMSALNIIREGGAEKIKLKGVPKLLEEYLRIVQDGGGKLVVCTAGMPVLGLKEEDLIDGPVLAGAPSLLSDAQEAATTLTF